MSPRPADPELPATLIEAAARLLAEEGPGALSTRRVASEVGTSTMAVYTYFGGMDDLVRAMVHEGFTMLDDRMSAIAETEDPASDVAALGLAYRYNAIEHRHLYSVMFGDSSLAGFRLNDEDRQHGRYTLEALVKTVARCMAAGRFDTGDAELVAHQLWIAVHGLVTLELGGYLIERYDADTCFDAQVRGLLIGAGDEAQAATRSVAASHARPDIQALAATLPTGPGQPVRAGATTPP
ncbi:MAG TPA: TetR/AcrR family transcriptional regulator [Trebonia sp.]|nr:TetR/AcrR family transcriptional regulator [Trebonia sp.]